MARDVNPRLEARALASLAHCDRISSRLRLATEASRRAAHLFEQLGDAQGEANALITLAHVCILLGRNDEAVEAALLSVRLCETKAPQPQLVLAYNCLGIAYSWAGDHDRADASLAAAIKVAQHCVPVASAYQPLLNQVWVEASRLIDERFQTGTMSSLSRLEALAAECKALEAAGLSSSLLPGLQSMGEVISNASWALLEAWQGDIAAADKSVALAVQSLAKNVTWLDAFVRWAAAEIAWARQDWEKTQIELESMRVLALSVEHEQLACRAHLLLAQAFEIQGRHEDALRENRALRRREQRVVADGLVSREALVSWRLDARQSQRHLQQALITSKQFERWSLEDALTGIANRRSFERALEQRLQVQTSTGRPLTVALVDVDRFKSVNDRFTHQIGDRVLKTVAALMASSVREQDLSARWAGDEFVILFDNTTTSVAIQVCEHVQLAVAGFDWEAIAPGLQVSVSIGLSEAQPGDAAEAVIHRSDKSMYLAKLRPCSA
ncbi:tetratricopeptide repeat-containing diguanylate cyclase [Pigmentiphaga aceris]|nr:GGDEF domain-containing protein [Pigmentiphaga aceris]